MDTDRLRERLDELDRTRAAIRTAALAANPAQGVFLALMRLVDIEGRHGADWADDLEAHRDLWDAAMPHDDPGICLRDLKHGYHPDTLYILTTADRLSGLLELIAGWHPDETDVLKGAQMGQFIGSSSPELRAGTDPRRIVRLWWD